ncbi:MAG: aryl-sulfate sulfotransferase [Bacteroidota bacterium]
MMKNFTLFLLLSFSFLSPLTAQRTVGLLSYDITQSYQGYTLIYPHNQPNVYLLNNCGEIVHTWEDEDDFRPGNTAYLMEDGSLIKTKRESSVAQDPIWAGGGGAIVEIRSWDNTLQWSYELNDSTGRLHHDIEPMPNGNILMLAWELKTNEEAVAAGRDPSTLNQTNMWPDYVFEINPENDEIVWEWHAWDHLVQDFDDSKENFGVVSEQPGRIDVNWDTNEGRADWMHSNALDFNPELNQVMISVPQFHEIWVIDHSTTTEQAAGSTGGRSNKGGDLLYRVGNQQAYKKGDADDQILFYQHDTHWTNEFLPSNHPFSGHMVCFNNRVGSNYSSIEIFEAPWSMYTSDYEMFNGTWPPYSFQNTITHPDSTRFYSTGLSSAQLLPNGNMLSCSGRQGYIIELTPDNEIVWEYVTPLRRGQQVNQGDSLSLNDNLTFRAFRYPPEYSAFDNRDLEGKGYLELDPDDKFCDLITSVNMPTQYEFGVYPNPASNFIHLSWNTGEIIDIRVVDIYGRTRLEDKGNGGMKFLDTSQLEPNIYFVIIDNTWMKKVILQRP